MATRLGDVLRHLPIRLSFDGTAKQSIEVARHRLVIGGVLFALAFGVVSLRLVDLTLMKEGQEPRLAHLAKSGALEMERADIVDRNGVLLATSLATASLYANPKLVLDADDAAAKLARLLPGLPEAELRKNLSGERSFVWVRRNLTPRQQYEVNRLGLPGFFFRREERRVYPQSAMMGHSVGFTDIDNRGLAGVEQSLDERLRQSGEPVQLSIDLRAQYIVREELAATIAEFKAIGGAAIVMDVGTGELLAMASLPDFDPNSPGTADPDARFNRATLGVYEMGSTFKIFTAAMALDFGTMTMRDGYDATKPIQVSRFTITDYHAQRRWLSLPEIMVYSSNIGAVKMALDVGRERQREFLGRLGLLKASPVELPEVGAPMLPNPWRDISTMTVAFGHGISVSPLQLITGVSAVVNGGILRTPTILKRPEGEDAPGERVMAQSTSTQLRQLMRLVVEKGTGKGANVPGYDVGGKTGTSDKNVNGRYKKDSRISSFVGAFPMSAPRYAVLVMVDEPKGTKATFGYATAGWVAAPAAGRIVSRIAALYGVAPADGTITADARDKLAQNASVRR
jgi:cell division protein FtsI (penicillin-binding protein 3)